MPFAATHIILTLVIVDLYRDYISKKKFPTYYVLLGGIAGLLPDIDIPIGWIYNLLYGTQLDFHGGITHIILFPVIFAALALIFRKSRSLLLAFSLLSFGWLLHIGMDCIFTNRLPLWPFSGFACPALLPEPLIFTVFPAIDAFVLVAWLIHEEWRHKIRDYI